MMARSYLILWQRESYTNGIVQFAFVLVLEQHRIVEYILPLPAEYDYSLERIIRFIVGY